MSYTVCNIDKNSFNSVITKKIRFYQSHQYDVAYMFQRYSLNPNNFVEWFIQKINLTGNEVALELGCLSESYWIHDFKYMPLFKKLYLVDEKIENVLQAKRILKSFSNTNISLNQCETLNIENKALDLAYSHNIDLNSNHAYHVSLLSEILRVLKDEGTFYYTYITEDYYASLYKLIYEYDPNQFIKDQINNYIKNNQSDTKEMLENTFSYVEVDEFQSVWMVNSVDDLIGFILCDEVLRSLRYTIFQDGLSSFRSFLKMKIDRLGGITLQRRVSVITCRGKRAYS